MYRATTFVVVSILLAVLSRDSLRDPRSHGFHRYFAWMAIVGLILINFPVWFRQPVSVLQLISWTLLVGSLVFVVVGTFQLRRRGRPDRQAREEEPLIGLERTTKLVTTGIFRYVRHPLYSSLLLLAWGAFFKDPSWLGAALSAAATGFLVATAKAEEEENVRFFGEAYRVYMRRTKLFVPHLF